MMLIGVFEEHIGSYVVHILPIIRLGNFDILHQVLLNLTVNFYFCIECAA